MQEEEEEEYIQFLRGEKDKADLRKDKDIAQELVCIHFLDLNHVSETRIGKSGLQTKDAAKTVDSPDLV